jgi:putative FmdB family regulatory protein
MPRYDFDCAACGTRFEVVHGVFADPPTACPVCGGGPIKKAFAPPTIHFKGSGWAKKERRSTVAPGSSTTAGGDAAPATAGKGSGDGGGTPADAGAKDRAGTKDGAPAKDAPATTPVASSPGPAAD